ncbi:MAG: hypothetical protein MI757_14225 [Pirellulales bacterium]|nr:hypothetical protein [Pirellulales bacterium]
MPKDDGHIYDEYARKYPPLIDVKQAGEIAHAAKATIHSWSSAGRLDDFKHRSGRQILLERDAFVRYLLNEEEGRNGA